MAVFHPRTVQCVCGNPLTVLLADSINARRSRDAFTLSNDMHKQRIQRLRTGCFARDFGIR